MAKKKTKAKPKNKAEELKPFMLITSYTSTAYRYIMAKSQEHAQQMWDDGTWESAEYDFDECTSDEELEEIAPVTQ